MITTTSLRVLALTPAATVDRSTTTYRYFQRQTRLPYYIYTPTQAEQIRGGHVAGLWYFKPASVVGRAPVSNGYRSCLSAEDAVNASIEAGPEIGGAA